MPELPDVELLRRYVDATSLHRPVAHTHVRERSMLDGVSMQKLAGAMDSRSLDRTRRHGKLLAMHVEGDGWLVLHFGMTGDLRSYADPSERPEHAALVLDLARGDQHLAFTSTRRLGRIAWADDFDAFVESEDLGPDALDIGLDALRKLLGGSPSGIKSLLTNQRVVAGLGNVYTDEILFQAGVAPDRRASDLSADEGRAVHRAMLHVLRIAIERGADREALPDSWLLTRRKEGERCPRCGGTIRRTKVNGRSTYFCPECQQ